MTTGVHVKMDGFLKQVDDMEKLIRGTKPDIMRYGRSLMRSETARAFASKADPNTGRAWPGRKGAYPWPLLKHTGTLMASLDWGYGIKTKSGRPKFFGKVREGSYLGAYNRGAGPKPLVVVAGSVFFGRTKARSTKGTKIRSRKPLTGATPPRPFFGFSRSSRKRFARYAEKRLAKAFD